MMKHAKFPIALEDRDGKVTEAIELFGDAIEREVGEEDSRETRSRGKGAIDDLCTWGFLLNYTYIYINTHICIDIMLSLLPQFTDYQTPPPQKN